MSGENPIRAWKQREGTTFRQLAERVRIPVSTISNWIAGRHQLTEDRLAILSEQTGIPVEELRPFNLQTAKEPQFDLTGGSTAEPARIDLALAKAEGARDVAGKAHGRINTLEKLLEQQQALINTLQATLEATAVAADRANGRLDKLRDLFVQRKVAAEAYTKAAEAYNKASDALGGL